MARTVVCVSRSLGAGGEDVGRLVADRLGYVYVDEDVIARAAALGGIDLERVADEERRRSRFAGLLDYLADAGAAGYAPVPPSDEPQSDDVRTFIRDAIQEIAERGNAVIVAHAASHAVGAGPNALRVLVTAPPETRAARLGTDDRAAKTIAHSDRDRVDYLRRFYGVGEELPTHYDVVVNTETITPEQAAELIVHAASA